MGAVARKRADQAFGDDEVFEGILPGRYALEDESRRADGSPCIFSCRAQRVSTERMIVEGPVRGRVGECVKAWIEHFDLLEGVIHEVGKETFTLRFSMGVKARRNFASKISWVRRHVQEGLADLRCGKRMPKPHLKPIIILGTVVREIETGFAMRFDVEQSPDILRKVLGWVPIERSEENPLSSLI